jgi:hypothetical protein
MKQIGSSSRPDDVNSSTLFRRSWSSCACENSSESLHLVDHGEHEVIEGSSVTTKKRGDRENGLSLASQHFFGLSRAD